MTRRHACEEASLVLALENLLTFPWVRRRVEAGKLALHAWYFAIATGHLFGYDRERCEFRTIDPNISLKTNKRS